MTMADSISVHVGTVEAYDVTDGLLDSIVDPLYKCDYDPVAILCSNKDKQLSGKHG